MADSSSRSSSRSSSPAGTNRIMSNSRSLSRLRLGAASRTTDSPSSFSSASDDSSGGRSSGRSESLSPTPQDHRLSSSEGGDSGSVVGVMPPPPLLVPQRQEEEDEEEEDYQEESSRGNEADVAEPSQAWTTLPTSMSTPRSGCAAAVASMNHRAVVVVVGGRNDDECLATAECYDVEDGSWTLLPPMPASRQWCAAASVDHRVYVLGGYDDMGTGSNQAFCFDFDTWAWTTLPRMQTRRGACAAASVGRKGIVVVGGHSGSGSLASAEYFDFDVKCWELLPTSMATPRSLCAAVTVTAAAAATSEGSQDAAQGQLEGGEGESGGSTPHYKLIVLGGHDGTSRLSSVECYDFRTAQWSSLPSMSTSRRACSAAVTERGILVAGGFNKDGLVLATTEHYDLAFQTWTAFPNMTSPRYDCAAVSTVTGNDKTVIVLGGHNDSTRLATCERLVWRNSLPPLPQLPAVASSSARSAEARIRALEEWSTRTHNLISDVQRSRDDARALCSEVRDAALAKVEERKRRILQEYHAKTKLIEEHVNGWLVTVERRLQETQELIEQLQTAVAEQEEGQSDDDDENDATESCQVPMEDPPDQLTCRLTQELLVDPVIATDGHTYEREAIVQWFSRFPAGQNPRSPATNETLACRTLISNFAIKSQCDEFRQRHSEKQKSHF